MNKTFPVLTTQPKYSKSGYFKSNSTLSDREEKFCRCALHVLAKNQGYCNKPGKWGRGTDCYNPYAVCAKSTRTSSRHCGDSYDFSGVPDNELRAYAQSHSIAIPTPYDRNGMLANLRSWKTAEGK